MLLVGLTRLYMTNAHPCWRGMRSRSGRFSIRSQSYRSAINAELFTTSLSGLRWPDEQPFATGRAGCRGRYH